MFFLGKCVRTVTKTMLVESSDLLCLASGPLPNAVNSRDVPTEFAGGDQLSVPTVVRTMSVLCVVWCWFFYCYTTVHIFRFTKCFCEGRTQKRHFCKGGTHCGKRERQCSREVRERKKTRTEVWGMLLCEDL